jgi:hypothetical protein
METNNNNSKNLVDLMIETQSNVVDQVVETTKKLTKDLPFVNETLDKGNKLFKEIAHTSAEFIEKTNNTINETAKEMNQNSENTKNYFEQWFDNQMHWAKSVFNANNSMANSSISPNPNDWMNNWQNFMSKNNGQWMNAMNTSPLFNMMNNNSMATMQNKMHEGMNQWSHYAKQYFDLMNSGYGDWWKKFSNLTAADSFKGMNQMNESLSKFYELWVPMFKNIEDKNFNLDIFRQLLNPEKYKEFIDKFFHFMPDESKKSMEQFNHNFIQYMKQFSEQSMNYYQNFKSQMQNNPWMNSNPFNQMMEMYSNWRTAMNEAVSPLSRLVEENSNVKQAKIWNEIYDNMLQFNIKNSELQYMMYQHGIKVMENVAQNVSSKIQKGESIESIIKIFQDWLMTGDEVYGTLFQSDEYSKLMTEVNSLQLKIKQEVDLQMEKMFFVNLPVATRSEMDEVYKSLYDLKKMYRQLERKLNPSEKIEETKATSKKK